MESASALKLRKGISLMAVKLPPDSPLPAGWLEEIFEKVDLERSFMQLRGIKHFWVEAWKGYIRSQQLRFASAWKYFDRAYEAAQEAEETIPNLVRQFILNIWCFRNALMEAPLANTIQDVPEAWIPELPAEILDEYPEVRRVITLRRGSEADLRLHLGQYSDAAELYSGLIEEHRSEGDGEGLAAFYYLGLAACEYNLDFKEEALRNLENAGLVLSMNGRNWNKINACSDLYAFYKFLALEDEAQSWDHFLERLPCPAVTRDLYKRRSKLVLDRCLEKSTLLLLS